MKNETIKKVNSLYNGEVLIDESTRQLMYYDNAKKQAIYNAHIVENGDVTMFCTDYIEEEVITDLEARIRVFGSPIIFFYAYLVHFNSDKYDSDNKIWNKIVNYVKTHEDEFFLKNGNLKKKIKVDKKLNIVMN